MTVRDAEGKPVPGATVSGTWSGLIAANVSAVSATNGLASLKSPRTQKRGNFVFTVTGISLNGYSYQPALNVESADSITR